MNKAVVPGRGIERPHSGLLDAAQTLEGLSIDKVVDIVNGNSDIAMYAVSEYLHLLYEHEITFFLTKLPPPSA